MRHLIFGIPVLVLFSCSGALDRAPKPEHLIPKEKMVEVVKEMVKIESYVQRTYGNVARFSEIMKLSGDSLLTAHELDRKTYESSIDYYGSRQEEMQAIYGEALNLLDEELGEIR